MSYTTTTTRFELAPFNELNRLRSLHFGRFSRPISGLAKVNPRDPQVLSEPEGEASASAWTPAVDVVANASHYRIAVEIPGTKREDVSVEFHERVLTIKGSKERISGESNEDFFHLERRFGTFERTFRLPEDAKQDDIKAVFRDGVLTVEIPKIEARKPTNVAIEA